MKYKYNNNLLCRELKETTMIYNPANSDMYELNETGQMVLENIKKGLSVEEMIDIFAAEFDEKPEVIAEDIKEICDRFLDLGIIVLDESAT